VSPAAPISRRKDGSFAVALDPSVRAVLLTMAEELAPSLRPDEPMSRRLFPPAYTAARDGEAEEEYRSLVNGALANHHQQAFATTAATANAETLDESELTAWLSAVEAMRLVLGTRLDVSEEMQPPAADDPRAPEYALYDLLGQLQFLIVEVLAEALPEEGRSEGDL
jgi:hypothetical protein